MSHSQKISSFNVNTSLNDSDLFTLVVNSTNKNIKFSDFKSSLGVTGTLSQTGDPLGVPTYYAPTVGDNKFRNIESTKGVIASVSAQDGIALGCNFTQPVGGFSLIEDLNAATYSFRGVKGVNPVEVNLVNDFLEFSLAESPLNITNTVIVSDMSDFPAPIGGIITLEDNTNYIIVQPLTTASRFVCGTSNHITANNPFTPVFNYTGSDAMFTGVDVNFLCTFIVLDAPNGTLFDFKSTGSGNTFGIDTITIINAAKFGVFDDLRSFNANNVGGFNLDDGVTLSGTNNWQVSSAIRFRLETTSATFIGFDLGSSTHQTIEMSDPIFRGPVGAIGISGLIDSGNVSANQIASVTNGEFSGGLTPLQNISQEDIRWDFQGNSEIPDSVSDSLIYVEGSTTQTVIASTGVKVKVNNVWTEEASARFDFDPNGRITYIGEKNIRIPIDLTSTLFTASGGDKQAEMCIGINGVLVTPTCKQATVNSSKAASVTTIWQHEFVNGDYVEVFVSNESDTTNVIVEQAIVRIN